MLGSEQQSALLVGVRNIPPVVAGRHRLPAVFQQRIALEEAGNIHQEEKAQHTPLVEGNTRIERVDLEPLLFWEGVCLYRFQVAVEKGLF